MGAWADEYLATVVNLRASTRYTYERDLGKYVLPRFARVQLAQMRGVEGRPGAGEGPLAQLGPPALPDIAPPVGGGGAGPAHPAQPVRPGDPTVDPIAGDALPHGGGGRRPRRGHRTVGRAFIYTAAYAGLRWSELVGLRAKRVDLLRRTVTVTEQLLLLDNGRRQVWEQPKTKAGVRSIGIPAFLADMLQEQLDERALPGADGLVFPNRAGKPTASASFSTHHFTPAKRRAGIDGRPRFHNLRHTAVALAIA